MGKTVGNLDKYIQIDLSNFSVNGHTHNYVPLSGGTMTGNLKFSDVTSTTYPAASSKITWNGSTDGADIYYQVDASDQGRLVLNTRDDANCLVAFANKGTIHTTIDNSGNFSGNAATATKLATARTLTIGSTGKTFDGSGNVSWTLAEIGAAATNHTHTYLNMQRTASTADVTYQPGANKFEVKEFDQGCANLPTKHWYHVLTGQGSDAGYNTQLAIGMTTQALYYRNKSTSWNSWAKVYTSVDKPTPADIGAAASSHGTHVTWSTTTPKVAGTASVGTETKVARGDHVHPLQTTVAQLANARTLTIGNTGKTFNGTANVSWSLSEIGAIAKIKIPTAGDQSTYVKIMEIGDAGSGNMHAEALIVGEGNYGTTQHTFGILRISSRGNRLVEYTTLLAHDSGTFEVGYVRDDTNKKTIVYLKRGNYPGGGAIIPLSEVGCSFVTSLTNLTTAPTGYTAGATRTMALTTSNVASANKLSTARTLTIGNKGKTFDGSANVSWSLAEIGALPLTGGTLTGNVTINQSSTNAEAQFKAVRTDTGTSVWVGVGVGGANHGVYSDKLNKWLMYSDGTNTYLNGGAEKLTTARTLTVGNTGKSFNGTANVSWTLAEIGALPAAGGTMTGILTISAATAYDSAYTKAGTFTDTNVKRSMIKFASVSGSSDPGAIYLETSATTADANKGVLHLCPSDDGTNDGTDYVSIHGTNDAENIKLHTGGAASFAGNITAPTFVGALSGNAATATKAAQLTTARKINGTSFNGTADITTANWGTARNINRISVNGSADVKLPLDYYTCSIGNDNTNLYHHILASGQCTGDYTDKSITIVLVNHYNGAGLGIAKATLRTNNATNGNTATAELRWLVRSGFSENSLCYNLRNTAKDTYMDVFYKSGGTYASLTWYVLTEGARGSQNSSTWTKYNTNASGTNAYTEANMKALRTYTSTLVSGTDHGNVNYAKSANTATSATTANAANVLNSNTKMDYGWNGLNYFNVNGTAGNAAKANDTPTTAWWHIIRCNHANSAGFYTDIAVPFNATSMYYKRIASGAVQNSGWVQILDKLNYKSTVTPANIGAEVATVTHSAVDLNTSGFSSSGTKTADTMASTGNCYSFTSTTTATKLAAGNFNAVKFGKYALCLRVKSSNNTSTATLLTVTVKHGSTTLLTKNIKGTDFTSTSQYSNIYTSFDFDGTSSARGTLSIQVNTGTTSGITLRFDYAYITLMAPSVFI